MTAVHLREHYPDIFTIFDAKRGDIGSTNEHYAKAIFDELGFDAVTLQPYLGAEALEPFFSVMTRCQSSSVGRAIKEPENFRI